MNTAVDPKEVHLLPKMGRSIFLYIVGMSSYPNLNFTISLNFDMNEIGMAALGTLIDVFLLRHCRYFNWHGNLVATESAIIRTLVNHFGHSF